MTVTETSATASEALGELTMGLRDCKQILAREMTMWAIRGPSLETDIALAALAQDELGHAQVFAAVSAHEFSGQSKRTERVGLDDAITHPAALPFAARTETWPEMVALMCLWDSAVATILEALTESSFEPLRTATLKMNREESHHWIFARAVAADLMTRDGQVPRSLRAACKTMVPKVQRWFADIADLDGMRRQGLVPDVVPMARYASRIGPILEEMKLAWPTPLVSAAR